MPPKRKIGKNKRKNKNSKKSQRGAKNGRPSLRFDVGDTVECKMNTGVFEQGVVVQHWWRAKNWPPNQIAPYQVRLNNGMLIFVPMDDPGIIRQGGEAAPPLRFKVGHRVKCKTNANPETWEPGVIIAVDFPLPNNAALKMPYQICLDNSRIIFAPVDNDDYIQNDPDRQGEEMSQEVRNIVEQKNLRFKVGDVVECKIRPMPEEWATGTITNTGIDHPQMPNIKVPYEIRLHRNNAKIYAPADTEEVIREPTGAADKVIIAPPNPTNGYRFAMGRRVECKMHPVQDIWEKGSIIAVGVPMQQEGATREIPYQILLDNGQKIYAPLDDDMIIRAEKGNGSEEIVTVPGTEVSLDDDFFESKKDTETNTIESITKGIEDVEIEELD